MGSLLLAVIYLIFISLGLPDSLLGSGWPKMQTVFGVPSSYAGYVSMAIAFMTIISALISTRLMRKVHTKRAKRDRTILIDKIQNGVNRLFLHCLPPLCFSQ